MTKTLFFALLHTIPVRVLKKLKKKQKNNIIDKIQQQFHNKRTTLRCTYKNHQQTTTIK